MLRTCFSTVPSVTHSRRPIPALDSPCAINVSTSRSRLLSAASGSYVRRGGQFLNQCRVDHAGTGRDAAEGFDENGDIGDPVLEQATDRPSAGQ